MECGRLSRNAVMRLTVLLSAIALVICASVFPAKGAGAVNKTIDTIRKTAEVGALSFHFHLLINILSHLYFISTGH